MSTAAIEAALYAKMNVVGVTSLATGGIHRRKAPPGSGDLTVVIYDLDDGRDIKVLGASAWLDTVWNVRAVCEGLSTAPADAAYAAVHALLEGAVLTINGFTNLYCRREQLLSYDEDVEGGKTYQHVGGTYRVVAA